jgi:tRNA threonylcarbamoyladenosine biosynthesis protein TsaE
MPPDPSPDPARPWRTEIALPREGDTDALGRRLASRVGPGDALLLSGPVGAGKSALARALIRARLRDPAAEVPSPTFTLVQTYELPGGGTLWHADLYRLSGPAEALELGLAPAFGEALCLVEWPDRLGPLAPPGALQVALLPEGEGRRATLSGPVAWAARLGPLDG